MARESVEDGQRAFGARSIYLSPLGVGGGPVAFFHSDTIIGWYESRLGVARALYLPEFAYQI